MSTGRVKRQSTSELMDDWLDSQGLYRKHIANDSSCLFRAVSEQLFNTQVRHMEVRTSCADYMEKNSAKFSALIEDSFENYIASVRNPKEWGGQIELMAMSSLFKCDFSVFQDVGKAMYKVTNNGYSKIVVLCQTSGNHYDSVYPKSFIQIAAISQSIVYEILYKKVFVMGEEVDFAVETMLHDKVYAKSRKDSTASVDSNPPLQFGDSSEENDSKDVGSEIRQALARGFPPFPYKVAKALDASIYRNVEFDVWNESKKGEVIYEPGVKCLVRLDKNKPETYHAHIQEMLPDLGPVTLYIVELGKKQTVPYECLEPLPANKNYNTTGTYYQKQMMNGSPTEFENYKGKKKLFKKTKYKFSVSIPRGQSIPPRFQSQQQSQSPYNNHGMGRERELPNQGMSKSNSPNFKWVATVSPNHGYRSRNPEGNKYVLPELTYAVHDNHNYKIPALTRNNEKPLVQLSNTASPALPWPKSSRSPNINNSGPGSNDGDRCSESMANNGQLPKMKMQEISNESSLHLSANNNLDIHTSNAVDNRPKDLSTTSPPPPLMVNQQFVNQDNSVMATPQPVALFPYQYVGVCLPYETPINSVNYGTPRSRDPHGSDLPLHDLATLRFFYNLGHDYFRSATIIPMATNQYHSAVWSYGPQLAFQAVGGYGTPASGLGNDNETMPDSPGSNGMGLPLGDPPTTEVLLDANSPTKFYEPTYFYDVSHINLVSSPFQPPMAIDYSSIPSPPTLHSGVGGEFKEGLVLNEQGVLSLSSTTQGLSTNSSKAQSNCHNQQQQVYQHNVSSSSMRFRSDSATSNRNSSATINNWQQNAMNSKFDNLNHAILNSTEPNVMNQPMYSSTKTDSNLPSQRYQSRVSSSKPIPTTYNAPPPSHRHHHPQPTSFPVIQAGSPIMAASSPTVYTGLGSPTTYYSSPPTTALLYPPPHVPQQISYMTSTAQ